MALAGAFVSVATQSLQLIPYRLEPIHVRIVTSQSSLYTFLLSFSVGYSNLTVFEVL
jgi:hypothetical protein